MAEAGAFYLTLGRRIQALRRGRLTQEQLGSRIEPPLTRAAIANIEGGKQGVLVYTLVQIASNLGVTPSDLLPSEPVAHEQPMLREQMQSELVSKLSVPAEASKRLAAKLLGDVPQRRRKHEQRSARKSRR